MIDHVWTVLCSHAITDTDTNNLTLYNTIEQVSVLEAPQPGAILGLTFEVVSFWIRAEPSTPATGVSTLTL